jgi:hypothetical protein
MKINELNNVIVDRDLKNKSNKELNLKIMNYSETIDNLKKSLSDLNTEKDKMYTEHTNEMH